VVAVGDTDCEPFKGTVVPFRSAVVAFWVDHVKVELPPVDMTVGLAAMAAAGGPLLAATVTVAWPQSVAPDAL
jgi:hypothetical protein